MKKSDLEYSIWGKTPEEVEKELEQQGINNSDELPELPGIRYDDDSYGNHYMVKWELRQKFPKSYFYEEYYDQAICGVNLFTGSIIYELTTLGSLYTLYVESHYGDYGAVLECGGIVSSRINELTSDQLEGKVPPTVILLDDYIKEWEYVRRYLSGDMP